MSFVGKYVSIKSWARKDDRPFGARNMYRVCRETEKAVLLNAVDCYDCSSWVDYTFWCPKSAIVQTLFD